MIDNQELQLESQISQFLMKGNEVTTHFKYEEVEDKLVLSVYTFNIKTNVNFLFHQSVGSSPMTVLSKMYKYIKEVMPEENNYTVIWELNESEGINESYFRGTDIEQVMVKFYTGKKDRSEINVIEVKLNPIS